MTSRPNDYSALMGLHVWVPDSSRPEERDDAMEKTVE